MPDLLEQLALPASAIFRKSDAGAMIGTGPFRITAWEPGRRLTLAAFDDYWGGRPYLDAVAIEFGTGRGHADLFDIPVGPARRILPEGLATWSSAPRTLVAITSNQRGSRRCFRRWRWRSIARPIVERARAAQGGSGFRSAAAVALAAMRSCFNPRRMWRERNRWFLDCDLLPTQPELPGERFVSAIGGRAGGFECARRRDRDPTYAWRQRQSAIDGVAAGIHRRRSRTAAVSRRSPADARSSRGPKACISWNEVSWMSIASSRWFTCARPTASRRESTSSHQRPTRSASSGRRVD